MEKKHVSETKKSKKIDLDLDAALEEVAKKLRPNANSNAMSTHSNSTSSTPDKCQNCCY